MTDSDRPLAVVTGASSGIGLALAHTLLERGHDLLITSEDEAVDAAAASLGTAGGTAVAVRADLAREDGVTALYDAITGLGRPVDVLALNAGVGLGGPFVEQDVTAVLNVAQLNVVGSVHLARLVLADMVGRGAGRMLVTSSIASLMPGSYQAVYNASKSFLQSFAQALQVELEGTGVTVTAMLPGPTATGFFARAGMSDDTLIGKGPKDAPELVAEQGVDALLAGRRRVVTGSIGTRVQYLAGVVLPDRAKGALHAVMAKPRGGALARK